MPTTWLRFTRPAPNWRGCIWLWPAPRIPSGLSTPLCVTWRIFLTDSSQPDLDALTPADRAAITDELFGWVPNGPPRTRSQVVAGVQLFVAAIVTTATETGMTLSDVEITRPDLESVFLHLTGKALRD